MPAINKKETALGAKRLPGRPSKGDRNMKLFRVYLSEEQHKKALEVGEGVYAQGIRVMVDAYNLRKNSNTKN